MIGSSYELLTQKKRDTHSFAKSERVTFYFAGDCNFLFRRKVDKPHA